MVYGYGVSFDPYDEKSKDSCIYYGLVAYHCFSWSYPLRVCCRLGRQQFGKVANPSMVEVLASPHVTTLTCLKSRGYSSIRFFLLSTCERWCRRCAVEKQFSAIVVASGSITECSKIDECPISLLCFNQCFDHCIALAHASLNRPWRGVGLAPGCIWWRLFPARDRVCGVPFGHRSCAIEPEKLTSFETPKLPCQDGRFCRANRSKGKIGLSFYIAKLYYCSWSSNFRSVGW